MEKTCTRCGKIYKAKRGTSRYCSSRCRAYACRDRAPASREHPYDVRKLTVPVVVDLDAFNPKMILAVIASDANQPGATRVAACRAYLAMTEQPSREEKTMSLLDARTME